MEAFMPRNSPGTNYVTLMPNKRTTNYPPVSIPPFFSVKELSEHTAELGSLAGRCGLGLSSGQWDVSVSYTHNVQSVSRSKHPALHFLSLSLESQVQPSKRGTAKLKDRRKVESWMIPQNTAAYLGLDPRKSSFYFVLTSVCEICL